MGDKACNWGRVTTPHQHTTTWGTVQTLKFRSERADFPAGVPLITKIRKDIFVILIDCVVVKGMMFDSSASAAIIVHWIKRT